MVTLFNVPVKRMLVVALVLLMGCKDSDKNSSLIFEELNESLERSNEAIENSTRNLLYDLEEKKRKGVMAERAFFWSPKADSINSKTKELIESLKKYQLKNDKENTHEKKMSDLKNALEEYRKYILSFDSTMKVRLAKKIPTFDKAIKDESQLDDNVSNTKTFLLKLENDIRVSENMAVTYCNQQTALGCNLAYYMTSAIAASNSTKFGRGEEMVITLGVGEFTLSSKPSFFVNNRNIPPNENGIGEYKMRVGNKPGKYKAHVQIKYTAPDGRQNSLEKDIEYTVVE